MPLDTFLEALGIPRLSKVTARAIAKELPELSAVVGASTSRLQAIAGIGPETASVVASALKDKRLYQNLLDAGITIEHPTSPSRGGLTTNTVASPIANQRVYITGSVPGYKKDDLEALVMGAGGTWTSSVSRNMDLLVVGDKAGPAKLENVRSLGIKTMDAVAFLKLIGK